MKTLDKKTPISELHKFNLEHPGTLTTFWRYYYISQPNFCEWLDFMRKKDPKWNEYYKKWSSEQQVKHNKSDIVVNKEEDNSEKELTIKERIAQIREKYGNIN